MTLITATVLWGYWDRRKRKEDGINRIIRPPDIVVGGLIFCQGFFFFFFFLFFFLFFVSYSPRSLNGTDQNQPYARKWVRFENACPKSGVSPPPTNRGPKTTFWGLLRNLTATLMACLRNETRYIQSVKCVDNYKGSPTLSQNVMNFGPQTTSNSTCILPTLRKFWILRHCHAGFADGDQQTELNQTLPNGGW